LVKEFVKFQLGLKCVKRYSPNTAIWGIIWNAMPAPALTPTSVSELD
jgi:hypothetical protein